MVHGGPVHHTCGRYAPFQRKQYTIICGQAALFERRTYDIKLPAAKPVVISGITKEQIDMELKKGMDDIAAGRVVSADEVEAEMRRL